MKVPTIKEVLEKRRKDRNPLDVFVCEYVGNNRKEHNALQRVIDFVEQLK